MWPSYPKNRGRSQVELGKPCGLSELCRLGGTIADNCREGADSPPAEGGAVLRLAMILGVLTGGVARADDGWSAPPTAPFPTGSTPAGPASRYVASGDCHADCDPSRQPAYPGVPPSPTIQPGPVLANRNRPRRRQSKSPPKRGHKPPNRRRPSRSRCRRPNRCRTCRLRPKTRHRPHPDHQSRP